MRCLLRDCKSVGARFRRLAIPAQLLAPPKAISNAAAPWEPLFWPLPALAAWTVGWRSSTRCRWARYVLPTR